jgi:hypothetical protein
VAADYPVAQNSYDLAAERGRSAFDVGHTFAASFIWQPKFPGPMVRPDRVSDSAGGGLSVRRFRTERLGSSRHFRAQYIFVEALPAGY